MIFQLYFNLIRMYFIERKLGGFDKITNFQYTWMHFIFFNSYFNGIINTFTNSGGIEIFNSLITLEKNLFNVEQQLQPQR